MGHGAHLQKIGEIKPQEVLPKGAKVCFVFCVLQPTLPFDHLSCTDFDHFCNK